MNKNEKKNNISSKNKIQYIHKKLYYKPVTSDISIFSTIRTNNLNNLTRIIDKKSDLNIKDNLGNSALDLAIKSKNTNKKVIDLLFINGGHFSEDPSKNNLIHSACKDGDIDIIRKLLSFEDWKIFYLNKTNLKKESPLYLSFLNKRKEILEILLENKVKIDFFITKFVLMDDYFFFILSLKNEVQEKLKCEFDWNLENYIKWKKRFGSYHYYLAIIGE
jgi:ankyrin repeat protein